MVLNWAFGGGGGGKVVRLHAMKPCRWIECSCTHS